ncbi:hypothetical protein BDQ17DRAFT_782186 [Cyathus striatus]|nr:hypothetical protein BDQ17DRAFT_782186 [Cyathus striatus]
MAPPHVPMDKLSAFYDEIHEGLHKHFEEHGFYLPSSWGYRFLGLWRPIFSSLFFLLMSVLSDIYLFHGHMILSTTSSVLTLYAFYLYAQMAGQCRTVKRISDPALIYEEYALFVRLMNLRVFSYIGSAIIFIIRVIFAVDKGHLETDVATVVFFGTPTLMILINLQAHGGPLSFWHGCTITEKLALMISPSQELEEYGKPISCPAISFALSIPSQDAVSYLVKFLSSHHAKHGQDLGGKIIRSYDWNYSPDSNTTVPVPTPPHPKNYKKVCKLRPDTTDFDYKLLEMVTMLQRWNANDHQSIKRFSSYITNIFTLQDSLRLIDDILPKAFIEHRICDSIGSEKLFEPEYDGYVRAALAAAYTEAFSPLTDYISFFVTALENIPPGSELRSCFLKLWRHPNQWSVISNNDPELATRILRALTRYIVPDADFTIVWIGLHVFLEKYDGKWADDDMLHYPGLPKDKPCHHTTVAFLKALQTYLAALEIQDEGEWFRIIFSLVRFSRSSRDYWSKEENGVYGKILAINKILEEKFPMQRFLKRYPGTMWAFRIIHSEDEEPEEKPNHPQ